MLDYPIVTDKQLSQYRRTPKWKEHDQRLLKIHQSACPNVWIRLQNIYGRCHVNTLKIQFFLMNETYTDTHLGLLLERLFNIALMESWLEKSTKLRMLFRSQKTKFSPIGLCGWHQKWAGKNGISPLCGRNWWKSLILRSQHHFLITLT